MKLLSRTRGVDPVIRIGRIETDVPDVAEQMTFRVLGHWPPEVESNSQVRDGNFLLGVPLDGDAAEEHKATAV